MSLDGFYSEGNRQSLRDCQPTKAALKQAILRAHYQAMVWKNDIIPNPRLPSPAGFGWILEKGNSSKAYHRKRDQNDIKL